MNFDKKITERLKEKFVFDRVSGRSLDNHGTLFYAKFWMMERGKFDDRILKFFVPSCTDLEARKNMTLRRSDR